MYTSIDFASQILEWKGSLVPQTRGSHTPIGWNKLNEIITMITLIRSIYNLAKYVTSILD
jgi:hypothetical protein